ncbi:hypothetical protein [Meiothermus cerbereus]|uniref:hypothetical protein n=1 Tax=Meiothermus cerbereus TaxID=65552 RepID=UPI00047FFCE1|nr:hypothetical protein [Meiothermus cerbereus]
MNEPSPLEVVQRVRGTQLVCRTAILLLSSEHLGKERSLAAQLNLDAVNYAEWRLRKVLDGQLFLGLTKESLVQELDEIAQLPSQTNALLLYNLDIALSYLEFLDRPYVWDFLLDNFRKRPRALVIALPVSAEHLLPDADSRAIWHKGGRLAIVS